MPSSPVKQLAAPSSTPQIHLIPYSPADDSNHKRRYRALKEIVYELEDENNMIALKIAQARARVRGKERMNLSSLEPRETYSPTNISTSAQPLPSPARAPSIKAQSISPLIHLPDTTHHMAKADADVASQLEPNGEVKGEITND